MNQEVRSTYCKGYQTNNIRWVFLNCTPETKYGIYVYSLSTHEYLILTNIRYDWVKIVDFLINAYFCKSLNWPFPVCMNVETSKINQLFVNAIKLYKLKKFRF